MSRQGIVQFNHCSSESAAIWKTFDTGLISVLLYALDVKGESEEETVGGEGCLGKEEECEVNTCQVRAACSSVFSSHCWEFLGCFFPLLFLSKCYVAPDLVSVHVSRVYRPGPLNQQCSLSHFFPLENDKREGKHYSVFSPLPPPPPPPFQPAHLQGFPHLGEPYVQRHADTLQSHTFRHGTRESKKDTHSQDPM